MLYSVLIIAVIGFCVYCFRRWNKLPDEQKQSKGKQFLLWTSVAGLLVLVISGRAHWLMGVLAALLAVAGRIAQFVQFIPLFKKIFGDQASANQGAPNTNTNSAMTKQEAANILGLDLSASDAEVRLAHKKLMQKIHPDRGGSDALAKQINRAKDRLLSKK